MKKYGIAVFILITILFLTGCGKKDSKPGAPASTKTDSHNVSIKDFSYKPKTISIEAKGTVTWTNDDSVDHTVSADDKSFNSGQIPAGIKFKHKFNSAGSFTYHCTDHPNEKGKVIVTQ